MSFKYQVWLVVSLLILVNGFLLYTQHEKNKSLTEYKSLVDENTKDESIKPHQIEINEFVSNEFDKPLNLVGLFPKEYCIVCLDMELPHLNYLAEQYADAIIVMDIDLPYNINTMIQDEISVHKVDELSTVITGSLQDITVPTFLVADENGAIHSIYINDFQEPEKTELFYQRVNSLFDAVYRQ